MEPALNILPERLASRAEFIVNNFVQTDYQHSENIDAAGIYDCDCSEFMGFVLQGVAREHHAMVPLEPGEPIPGALEYYTFFTSSTLETAGGWRRVNSLHGARRGDIIAWSRTPRPIAARFLLWSRSRGCLPPAFSPFVSTIPPTLRTLKIRAGI
jgi:hypothetical protein